MTASRTIVVCKYNQARSITAAAALRRFFPDQEILSAGILANRKTQIPQSILEILEEWQLTEFDFYSTSVLDLPQIRDEDLVLCADEEVRVTFKSQLGIYNSSKLNIKIFQDYANSELEVPVDPAGMGESDTKLQLARSVLLTMRGLRQKLSIIPILASPKIATDRKEYLQIQQLLLDKLETVHGLILDTGFSIPKHELWNGSEKLIQHFNPSNLPDSLQLDESKKILLSKFEVDFSSRILLSTTFHDWLKDLNQSYELHVLPQPILELPLMRRHEAILSLIHS